MSMEMVLEKMRTLETRVAILETIDSVPVVAVGYLAANQTFTSGAAIAQVDLDEELDTFNAFATGTFTAPYGGYYHIDAGARWANDADWTDGDLAQVTVRVNGSNKFHVGVSFNFPASNPATQGSGRTVLLASGDTVDLAARHIAGADVDLVGEAEGVSTWLSIHRVRGY